MVGARDHVRIGQDVAVLVQHDAGAGALPHLPASRDLRRDRDDAGDRLLVEGRGGGWRLRRGDAGARCRAGCGNRRGRATEHHLRAECPAGEAADDHQRRGQRDRSAPTFATARRRWSRRRRRFQGKRFAGHEPIIAHEVS